MKKITKIKEVNRWNSEINSKSSLSYEQYMKIGLEIISKKITLRSYKLATKEDYPFFERGKDIRVVIFFNNKPTFDINGRKYEFIVELPFWFKVNSNKEDRAWMRSHADIHLECFSNAIRQGKEKRNNELQKTAKKKTTKKTKAKVGSTQTVFDEMKKTKK